MAKLLHRGNGTCNNSAPQSILQEDNNSRHKANFSVQSSLSQQQQHQQHHQQKHGHGPFTRLPFLMTLFSLLLVAWSAACNISLSTRLTSNTPAATLADEWPISLSRSKPLLPKQHNAISVKSHPTPPQIENENEEDAKQQQDQEKSRHRALASATRTKHSDWGESNVAANIEQVKKKPNDTLEHISTSTNIQIKKQPEPTVHVAPLSKENSKVPLKVTQTPQPTTAPSAVSVSQPPVDIAPKKRETYPPGRSSTVINTTTNDKPATTVPPNATRPRGNIVASVFLEQPKEWEAEAHCAHATQQRLQDRNTQDLVQQQQQQQQYYYCSTWEHAAQLDDWWQHHPEYDAGHDNDTHTCLERITNRDRIDFLRQVYDLQYPACVEKACQNLAVRHVQPGYGFASTMMFLLNGAFWSAFRQDQPFQAGFIQADFRWLYTPSLDNNKNSHNNMTGSSSWAACPTQDHECYFLPISNCTRPVGGKEAMPKKKYQFHELLKNHTLLEQNIWLANYLMRPRHRLRRHLYEFMKGPTIPQITTPCTWIHVRRADAMTEQGYNRNYYPLKEYLQGGKVSKQDNILLLTDDATTIEEATLLYPDYKWTYFTRTRHRGPVEYSQHLPSHDPTLEVLYILAERKLASQCQKGVYGSSNMPKLFRSAMVLEHGGLANITMMEIDKRLKKTRVEAQDFLKELESEMDAARKKSTK